MATRAAVQALGGGLEPQGGMMFSKEVTFEGGLGYPVCVAGVRRGAC